MEPNPCATGPDGRPIGVASAADALGLEVFNFGAEFSCRKQIAEILQITRRPVFRDHQKRFSIPPRPLAPRAASKPFSGLCLGFHRAFDNDPDALDARHHAQLGDGNAHPLHGKGFKKVSRDMLGQRFEQIEMTDCQVGA